MNCAEADGFRLGRFHPKLALDEAALAAWTARDTALLRRCRECDLAPMCGGGCARVVAIRGGRLADDVVCPPMVNHKDLQVLVDHYLPRILRAWGTER